MLFDLLATDMYVSYNVKLAHAIGLSASVYVSELININRKAIEKQKLIDDFFVVDRKYITKRTTLTDKEQKDLDINLSQIKLLELGPKKDLIKVNMDIMTGLLLSKDEKVVEEISKTAKKKRTTKQEAIVTLLKDLINVNNDELREAYYSWIDSVYAKQGWMSKKAVTDGQYLIDSYCQCNLDLALQIIGLADTNAYRDMTWAINLYEKNYKTTSYNTKKKSYVIDTPVKLSDEVF